MAAAYDTYDYPSYWEGRKYEHEAEVVAIKAFLAKIPKIDTILEIGAGFGRLTPHYCFRARRVILVDPSARLLSLARRRFAGRKNVRFVQCRLDNLPSKVKKESIALVVLVRVLHHLEDINGVFSTVARALKPNGYLILEFANKGHLKAMLTEFLKGNFTFPLDIFPKDIRGKKNRTKKTLPFLNYHPEVIEHVLDEHGFKIIEKRSVSNIRSGFLKRLLPQNFLILLESRLQIPLSYLNFGPSIFILAAKKG